jgi:hypothetical protein
MSLAGIETLHPDVFVIEQAGIPRIVGVSVNTGGFVGVTEKGPIDRADIVTTFSQYEQKYGKDYGGSFMHPSVSAFFNQGGTRCFIARVLGAGAVAANVVLADHEGNGSINMDAISAGEWGNDVSVQTERWRTVLAAPPAGVPPVGIGSMQIPVSSLRNVKIGDLIRIYDPVSLNAAYAFVYSINVALRVLNVAPLSGILGTFTFPDGSLVHSATDHRLSTFLAEPLVNGVTSVLLRNTSNLAIGARMYFDDGLNFTSVVVTKIDGKIIRFAPVATPGGATLPANTTIAVSQEFNIKVYEKGKFAESFEGLSMESANTRDYFGVRLAGQSNESRIISATDLFPVVVNPNMAIPLPVLSAGMAGGTDGAPVTDSDYIGSAVAPKSGMFLMGDVPDLNFFSIPGVTTVEVERAAADWADLRGNLIAVLDAPLADDEAIEVLNFRNIEANFDTSYAALYYPWVIVRDPNQNNARVALPPSGFIQGVYAMIGATRGVHYAPANVTLKGVLDLTHNTSDGEQDMLNPAGINVIRSFQGEGIRVWGARTLTSYKDGRHYVNVRRVLNYVKESLKSGLRFAIFELNDQRLWETIETTCNEFLGNMFLRGMLFSPDGTPDRAYFAKCDAETNPDSERREGRMNVEIGINPPLPAEFIVCRVGLWDGGSTVEEELARR